MKIAVYVAGPIGANDEGRPARLRAAIAVGRQLLLAGYTPFVPHLWPAATDDTFITYESWLDYGFAWVERCDLLLRDHILTPGVSPGADREEAHAKKCAIPIYYDIEKLMEDHPPVPHNPPLYPWHRHIDTLKDGLQPTLPGPAMMPARRAFASDDMSKIVAGHVTKGTGGATLFDLPVIGEAASPEFACHVDPDGVCRWEGCPNKTANSSDSDRFCALAPRLL